jgi:PKD repeat protein
MKKNQTPRLLLALLLSTAAVQAQQSVPGQMVHPFECATPVPSSDWDKWFNSQVEQYKQTQLKNRAALVNNYTVPVIIHVIHSGEAVGTFPNLSNAQLVSQVKVLNDDYDGVGYNTNTVPSVFANLISKTGIQFCLALKDTAGHILAEPGIDRVNYSSVGITNPASVANSSDNSTFTNYLDNTLKPATIWDPHKYMNIWVSDRPTSSGLLGYTTFPAGAGLSGITSGTGTAQDDGVWVYGQCFGTTGTLISGYNYGRVCSHESGHYFGLRHTWGDGSCADDYCNDTPPTQQANFNCPTFPHNKGTCSGNTTGEMTMNLMDYTNDDCKYMYTPDQTTRMQAAMASGTYRKLLGTHGLCNTGPAGPVASLNVNQTSVCAGSSVLFTDKSSNNPTAWHWTFAGGTPGSSSTQNPTVVYSTAGTFAVKLVVSNSVGKDSVTKTGYMTVLSSPVSPTGASVSRCGPGQVNLTASGTPGDSIQWFSAANSGTLLHTGSTYSVSLSNTATYYVSQQSQSSQQVGPVDTTFSTGGYFNGNTLHGLVFNVLSPCVLKSVKVYASTPGLRVIRLLDTVGGQVLQTARVTVPVGVSRINLNFNLAVANHYFIKVDSLPLNLHRNIGGASYPYTLPGVISITETDVAATYPGYYYYLYDWNILSAGCASPRTAITATVYPNPAPPVISSSGGVLTSTPATLYQWFKAGVLIANATQQNYTPLSDGLYTVQITDANGCSATSTPFNVLGTGIYTLGASAQVSVFPNPSKGFFTVKMTDIHKGNYVVQVMNELGQVVVSETLQGAKQEYSLDIDLERFGKGVYILSLRSNEQNYIRKLVVY